MGRQASTTHEGLNFQPCILVVPVKDHYRLLNQVNYLIQSPLSRTDRYELGLDQA